MIRGRHKWKFSRYPVPIGTQNFFSGRHPVPIGTQNFFSGRYPVPIGTQNFFSGRYPVPIVTINFLFFSTGPSDEYDSAPSRKYTGRFVPLSPVSVNLIRTFLLTCVNIIWALCVNIIRALCDHSELSFNERSFQEEKLRFETRFSEFWKSE